MHSILLFLKSIFKNCTVFGQEAHWSFHPFKFNTMITQLLFHHEGKQVLAELVFNFKAIADMILILPLAAKDEVGDYILFTHQDAGKWITDAPIFKKFPLTFESVADSLGDVFKHYRFSFLK
jgi:hypothetical protein